MVWAVTRVVKTFGGRELAETLGEFRYPEMKSPVTKLKKPRHGGLGFSVDRGLPRFGPPTFRLQRLWEDNLPKFIRYVSVFGFFRRR